MDKVNIKILMLGPQGSGKSTQAQLLAARLGLPLVDMGGILRTISLLDDSQTAKVVRKALESGRLVDIEITAMLINKRLRQNDCQNGFVLDGYPRNQEQFRRLDTKFDKVIYIHISDEEGVKRLLARQRHDDKPEIIAERLKIYHAETEPLLAIFRKEGILEKVNGERSIKEIHEDILKKLNIDNDKY